MTLSFGSLLLLAVVIALVVVGSKVRGNTKRLQELEAALALDESLDEESPELS